ncbi:MAG TPA: hypothetical protein VKY92_07150 [Verrucomicrobiae bacterium]|nr:hypothetical protein [Verrucomicrobiae bacterium]
MTRAKLIATCLAPITGAGVCSAAASPPTADITNGVVHVRLYLPDAQTGFYRGTRFDWAGAIFSLKFAGHDYFPQWFQRSDPNVRDFVYEGGDIVAGPCTAMTGPAEEFVNDGGALGFNEAKPGGRFVKIGVGVLQKPDDAKYEMFRLYPILDPGKRAIRQAPDSIEFTQELSDPATGYAYLYRKRVLLSPGKPRMVLEHSLRNTGKHAIHSSVYDHNFLYLDHHAPGAGTSITVPFTIQASPPPDERLASIEGNRILFRKTLAGEDRVYFTVSGFGPDAKDYDVRIENAQAGAGVHITGDRPLSRAALWSIRAPLSFEPFIDVNVEPGAEFTWRITYDFYALPVGSNDSRQ